MICLSILMSACSPTSTIRDPDLTRAMVEPKLEDRSAVSLYFFWLDAGEVIREGNERFEQLRSKQ